MQHFDCGHSGERKLFVVAFAKLVFDSIGIASEDSFEETPKQMLMRECCVIALRKPADVRALAPAHSEIFEGQMFGELALAVLWDLVVKGQADNLVACAWSPLNEHVGYC